MHVHVHTNFSYMILFIMCVVFSQLNINNNYKAEIKFSIKRFFSAKCGKNSNWNVLKINSCQRLYL